MNKLSILYSLFFILNFNLLASDLAYAPNAYKINGPDQAIFMDIHSASYQIQYDLKKRLATTNSMIEFSIEEDGFPLFDLKEGIKSITIDNLPVTTEVLNLEGSDMVMIKKLLKPGKYQLKIESEIKKNLVINFSKAEVKSAFWMSDLNDRSFLEQYLPTNLEFDHYPSTLNVEILGTNTEHVVYSNGDIQNSTKNSFQIKFPNHFTCSSMFFHLAPKTAFAENNFTYLSNNQKIIPITVYSLRAQDIKIDAKVKLILDELERDYGPWPHEKLVIYISGSGGMEFSGATITSSWALSHELFHSYFARGVMPGIGNSGWIDEALARWRDFNYIQKQESDLMLSKLAGHSIYRRHTDDEAYSKGSTFMGYLSSYLSSQKDFRAFLKNFYQQNLFKTISTDYFQNSLENYYNMDLDFLFSKYIFGKEGKGNRNFEVNPYHKKLTEKELIDLL